MRNNVNMHDPEDDDLFRTAVGPVRDIAREERVQHKVRPKPSTRMADADERDALLTFRLGLDEVPVGVDETLSYCGESLDATAWKKLRRGEYSALAELDLHDMNLEQAARALTDFIREARREEIGCVLIIHGKGRGSESIPQIKNLVNQRLRHNSGVLGFHSAPPSAGGEGALLVLLSRRASHR